MNGQAQGGAVAGMDAARWADIARAMPWSSTERPDRRRFDAAWSAYTGLPGRTDESEAWLLAVHPEDRERVLGTCRASAEAAVPFVADYRVRRADGTYRWLLDNAEPVRPTGGYEGTSIDIHSRRIGEDRLASRTQSLRETVRRHGDFLSTVAHELRNPLSPIVNAASLLRILEDQQPRLTRIREIIERQADSLRQLLTDMSEATRMNAQRLALHMEATTVGEVIDKAVAATAARLEAAGHRLTLDVDAPSTPLRADPVRLQQVLVQLLSNAIKFMPDPGEIRLHAHVDAVTVRITVSDDGVGLSAEALPRVFDVWGPGAPLVRTCGGLGLGLAIARRLARLHDGDITAHSPGTGQGTEFVLKLPRASVS